MVILKKINNDIVKPIEFTKNKEDNKPILGSNLFSEIYANIFICAKKKSGKTTIIYNVVRKCANSNTKVIIFSSTFHKDKSFDSIRDFCDKHKIYLESYTSLKDDSGQDILETMIKELENEVKDEEEKVEKPKLMVNLFEDSDEEDEPIKKPKKYKYRSPEYIFIFDDLSNELKSKSINMFLKKNRHFKSKVLLSSQYIHDLKPESLKQMDYFLLLKGHSEDKLEQFYKHADLSIDFETFKKLYKNATEDKFNFLYIDNNNGIFRKNFDKEYNI